MVTRSPQEIAAKGEKIYAEKFARSYERKHRGKFVAVDIDSKRAFVGDSPEQALEKAQERNPSGCFHLIRVGFAGLYRVAHIMSQA
jgi:hypothetical protein